jgi:5-formyltetrahydrofolate cyclo-ligase
MQKGAARKILLEQRKQLSELDCIKLDDLILIQFQQLDFSTTHFVGSYFPMESQSEPNSLLLTKYLQFLIPSVQVAYPVINANDSSMEFYKETEVTQENTWGIQEPLPIDKVEPFMMDTFLVPLLGFDAKGHRVGYGKGFYDRYFEKTLPNCKRIGIAYFEPLSTFIDTHQFDVPLTHCITPNRIYEF